MNELLTLKEAADKLKISVGTLRKYADAGICKAVIINKRGDRRFRMEDLQAFITGGSK